MQRSKIYTILVLLFIGIGLPNKSVCQTKQNLEQRLAQSFSEISRLYEIRHDSDGAYDSLCNVSYTLGIYLKNILPKLSMSFDEPIKLPNLAVASYEDGIVREIPQITLASSKDGKLRIWSWNTWDGGSMIHFKNVFEYRTEKDTKVVDPESDDENAERYGGRTYDTIYTIQNSSGLMCYLCLGKFRADGRNSGIEINGMSIIGDRLNMCEKIFFADSVSPYGLYNYGEDETGNSKCLMHISEEDSPMADTKISDDGRFLFVQGMKEGPDKWNRTVLADWWEVYEFDGKAFKYKRKEKKQ